MKAYIIRNMVPNHQTFISSFQRTIRLCSSNSVTGNVESSLENNHKIESPEKDASHSGEKVKLSGFAKAFDKFTSELALSKSKGELTPKKREPSQPFTTLLRHSKLMQIGDPQRKIIEGKIFHVVEEDLYIDFGGKFYCVCPCPKKNKEEYKAGSKVRLRLLSLEISSRFLGSKTDLTLLEADAILLGHMKFKNSPTKDTEIVTS